ncbi:MAG: response regulator transcription factor [Campylobacterales bacterium]
MNKILFVEDDRLYADTIEDFLSENGFDVDIVADGEAAIERLSQNRYDLYLIDLKLPKLGGFELLELIKNSGDDRLAIILTTNMNAHAAVKGFSLGCDDYIRKNCDLAELLERIRRSIYRSYHSKSNWIDLKDGYMFDLSAKVLMRHGEIVALKKKDKKGSE